MVVVASTGVPVDLVRSKKDGLAQLGQVNGFVDNSGQRQLFGHGLHLSVSK